MRKRTLLALARAARKRGDDKAASDFERQAQAVKHGGRKKDARNKKVKEVEPLVADALFLMEEGADAYNKVRTVARVVRALEVMSQPPARRPKNNRDTEEEINSLARRVSRARARRRATPKMT